MAVTTALVFVPILQFSEYLVLQSTLHYARFSWVFA